MVIKELRQKYNFADLLHFLKIPKSTYYYYIKKLRKKDKYQKIKEQIKIIFKENKGRYGYRRITLELRSHGYKINHKTVQKLMKILGLKCTLRVKKYKSFKETGNQIVSNRLKRNFYSESPNKKWVTDITQFSLFGIKIYLSAIVDLFNQEVICYNLSKSPNFDQVMITLDKAFEKLPENSNLILHSDQGWQYQMEVYRKRLEKKHIKQSMSRRGNCYDNAVIENFFGILKTEFFYLQKFNSLNHFEEELEKYISYYNNKRIKLKFNGLSPMQYKVKFIINNL